MYPQCFVKIIADLHLKKKLTHASLLDALMLSMKRTSSDCAIKIWYRHLQLLTLHSDLFFFQALSTAFTMCPFPPEV